MKATFMMLNSLLSFLNFWRMSSFSTTEMKSDNVRRIWIETIYQMHMRNCLIFAIGSWWWTHLKKKSCLFTLPICWILWRKIEMHGFHRKRLPNKLKATSNSLIRCLIRSKSWFWHLEIKSQSHWSKPSSSLQDWEELTNSSLRFINKQTSRADFTGKKLRKSLRNSKITESPFQLNKLCNLSTIMVNYSASRITKS